MANTLSSKKAIRVSDRRNAINKKVKDSFKLARKNVVDAVKKNDIAEAKKLTPKAYSLIDVAIKKGVIKNNTGSRYKSRLAQLVKKSDTK